MRGKTKLRRCLHPGCRVLTANDYCGDHCRTDDDAVATALAQLCRDRIERLRAELAARKVQPPEKVELTEKAERRR